MTLSVGVIYIVLGCLVLCETNAQFNGFDSYYNQNEYYSKYPQYTDANANTYHAYTTPAVNSKTNNVQVIEVSIPDIPINGKIVDGKVQGSSLNGVISQFLQTGQVPYTFSIHTYSGNKSPYMNPQSLYGSQATANAQSQSQYFQTSHYQQPNYNYQQQQYSYDQTQKQQQYEKELEIYKQKLKEYYTKYPSAIPQVATTRSPVSESVKPNEIKPTNHSPIEDDGKSLAELLIANQGADNNEPGDGKSLLELLNEEKGSTEGSKSLAELLGHQFTSPPTEAPKKSLDDLIGNVFTEKHNTATEAPNQGAGKSLFELLAELPPAEDTSKDVTDTVKKIPPVTDAPISPQQEKKNSDVAGGDYGLDVRTDDSKVKRTKRSILREGLRRITERISNFGNFNNERHTRDHDCKHHEGRNHNYYHNHMHHDNSQDEFLEDHSNEWHTGRRPISEIGVGRSHEHPHEHAHDHPHKHPHPNFNQDTDEKNNDFKPHHNQKPQLVIDNDKQFNQDTHEIVEPSRKPHSVDASTHTDAVTNTKIDDSKDATLDIDIRGGFEETRRKRHNSQRSRRSPDDEEVVFKDDDETVSKDVEKKEEDPKIEENVTESNSTETEGEGEKGELDSRFGFFGGGGGFHRQAGRRPVGGFIGGVVNGILGGGGINGGYDPYNRGPPPPAPSYPYYPDQGHGQQIYGYGGNYPPPPQPPVHIHINNVANAQSQATNTASAPFGPHGSNQNAAANAQSQNYQNEFGSFQNTGASGQASNLAADGSSGQLSAANAMNQNYQNEFGAGSKNAAQSQAANYDAFGNLALTSSNSGTNHFAGPDGVRDETNSAAQSSLQGQFGTQNSGAQSNTYQGPNGSGASASSQASSINNGHGSQNSGANAAANSGNVGGNSFGNAQSGTYANDQWGW